MPIHIAEHELSGSLYHFSLFENICLFYKTSSLAYDHLGGNLGGGGGGAFYG
jgi:hypothetical protein